MIVIWLMPWPLTNIYMPILKDFRQTKEISLPGYPDSKVVIFASLLAGDMIGLDTNLPDLSSQAQAFEFLPKYIKEWNFEREAGVPLEINKEGISLLTISDLTFLANSIQEFSKEVKKN